jgi:hypothetical protein
MTLRIGSIGVANNLQKTKRKRASFTGVSGSISKEFSQLDKDDRAIISQLAKGKRNDFLNIMLSQFRYLGILNDKAEIIVAPHKIVISKGEDTLNFKNLKNVKIKLTGGAIRDEAVRTLNVKSGIAKNISAKGLKATGGRLYSITFVGNNDAFLLENSYTKKLIAKDCKQLILTDNAKLDTAELSHNGSILSISKKAKAKRINQNIEFNNHNPGPTAFVENYGSLNEFNGRKAILSENSSLDKFDTRSVEIKSNFNGKIKNGNTGFLTCDSNSNGIISKLNVSSFARLFGKTEIKDSDINTLYLHEKAIAKRITARNAAISDNSKIENSIITRVLILSENAKVKNVQTKDLILYGKNYSIKDLTVTGKIKQVIKTTDENNNEHTIVNIFDAKNPEVKKKFGIK